MSLKITHSKFNLNLVDTSFTMIEDNHWFSDKLFSKYTYPFTFILSDEQQAAFDFITELNANEVVYLYDVYFYAFGEEHKAVLEVDGIIGAEISIQVRYGLEEFPNYNKKLAQLPLHKFELSGETMIEHAESIIDLLYPATDYNFIQVFTDKLDTSTEQWAEFLGIINNHDGTTFYGNEYDIANDIQINRNVLQPMPNVLYLLKAGLLDAGYTLTGDIIEDPVFKIAHLYSLSTFYSSITDAGKQELKVLASDFASIDNVGNGIYTASIIIETPGRYAISGNLFLRSLPSVVINATGVLRFNNILIGVWSTPRPEEFFLVEKVVEILPGESNVVLQFTSKQNPYPEVGGEIVEDATILDVTITQLVAFDGQGDPIPTLIAPNEIDLTKCVPDVTFGKLITAIRTTKNYDVTVNDGEVSMNRIQKQISQNIPINLTQFEIAKPERQPNQGDSYVFKYQDVESDEYTFPSIFIDGKGYVVEPFVKKDNTKDIIIDAIPLPLKTKEGVTTAHGFIDDASKIQFVLYNGLVGDLNLAIKPSDLDILPLFIEHHENWLNILINSVTFVWSFNSYYEDIKDVKIKSTIYAYGIYHIIRKIQRKNISQNIIQTEIETVTL